ncbi:hypothetical protein BDN71DRAFT_1077733 [Pleurotus eryngii]|uniref:Uncharacterized protein n=1 Tax=Pleurotus eryngii TaxID=5323 RepID=A0A9P5ZWF5_PLEER|nr:hypothetical protein BDN71DRAFT_1077733 [Pleurotus eryngii]
MARPLHRCSSSLVSLSTTSTMSEQSPPPKPKPGSLRDRIAAFEKSSASAAPAPPPPRPKPGGVSWKPKPPSPPSSPKSNPEGEKKAGGMSASDAKESIGKGVSLKERMAALQGKGGFGAPAPAPPTAPKPAVERPKWKPPPVVSPPAEEGSDPIVSEPAATADVAIEASIPPPVVSEDALTPPAPPADGDEKDQEAVDPDEEERQRRAAITARIARLGGARVGMGPPIFGRPAVPAKKPSLPHEESAEQKEAKDAEIAAKAPSGITDEPVQEHAIDPSKESYPVSEAESSSERLQPPEEVPPPRVPNSMPVPAVPRRAAPPRRKAKSPAPPLDEASFIPSTTEDEPPPAISDDVTPAATPALVSEEPADNGEEYLPKPPSLPPVDIHVEPVTAETGSVADLPNATPGTDDKEEGTPAVAHMDEATSSIADGGSQETIPNADAPDASLAGVETQSEEPPAPSPASEEHNNPNSPKEPSPSSAKESSQPEVKAESPLQQPNLEVHVEERADGRTVDVDDKATSPVSQRTSVDTIDDTPPAVDLTATSTPSDAVASPVTAPLREEENLDSVVESTEEEEEAARRARVAARLAKMGAVNPFAPPPQRRASHDVVSPPPITGSTKPADESVIEPSPVPRSPLIAVERNEEVNIQKDTSPELSEPSSSALDTSKTQKGSEDGKY